MQVFSKRLTELRKEKGVRQKDAAQVLGVSQSLLSHYEKGVRECGLDFVVRAARFYGVSTDYLLGTDMEEDFNEGVYLREDAISLVRVIFDSLSKDRGIGEELLVKARDVLRVRHYLLLMASIKAGVLPKSWCSRKEDENYLRNARAVSIMESDILRELSSAGIPDMLNSEAPEFLERLRKSSEESIETFLKTAKI